MRLDGKYPSINEYFKAVKMADVKEYSNKNVKNLMAILELMPTLNSRLAGHIRTRRTALRSWGWDIIPYEKSDIEKVKEVKYNLSKIINKVTVEYIMAQLYGVSLLELKWFFKDNTNIPLIENIFEPTELQKWDKQSLAIVDDNNNKKPIDNEDVNYIRILDDSKHVGGVLRTLAFTELLRYEIPKDWRNYNKKLKGIIQAITKSDYAEDYETAESGVKNVTQDNYVVSSELIDFKFHQMTTAGASQSFKEFNEALNNDIAIALLGNPNTTQLPNGGGSRAALQVQAMIGADIMYEDILNVQELINEQLIRADFEKNYSNGVPNWEFVIPTNLETDYQANASILTDILGNGLKVIKREVYQKIGYTMPTADDEVFEPAI